MRATRDPNAHEKAPRQCSLSYRTTLRCVRLQAAEWPHSGIDDGKLVAEKRPLCPHRPVQAEVNDDAGHSSANHTHLHGHATMQRARSEEAGMFAVKPPFHAAVLSRGSFEDPRSPPLV